MPDLPNRKNLRLREYDYSLAGVDFVTICTAKRVMLFASVHAETISLTGHGRVVQECWDAIPQHQPAVETDAFVIMPNHIHGLIVLTERVGARHASPAARGHERRGRTLGHVVGAFKSAASSRINSLRGTPSGEVWQRGYFERVLRNADELTRARKYIVENPLHWHLDAENPLTSKPTMVRR